MSLKGTCHIVTDEERRMSIPEKLAKYYEEGMISGEQYENALKAHELNKNKSINNATKKKKIKPLKSLRRIVIIILCVTLLISLIAVAVSYHNNAVESEYNRGKLAGEAIGRKKGYAEGSELYKEIKDEYQFFHQYAVIVTSSGNKYHRYDCYHIKDRSFYIYNLKKAKSLGYTPCLDCY